MKILKRLLNKKIDKINIVESLRVFDKYWQYKLIGDFNGQKVKLTKIKGEFDLHNHKLEDELVLILKGSLDISLNSKETTLNEGDFFIIPKGANHRLSAKEEAQVFIIEPRSSTNTIITDQSNQATQGSLKKEFDN